MFCDFFFAPSGLSALRLFRLLTAPDMSYFSECGLAGSSAPRACDATRFSEPEMC